MQLRTLGKSEVGLHRELRLSALRDAPDSFGEVLADVETRPLSYWEDLTRSVTDPERHVMFLACEGEAVHGMTYGIRDRERCDIGRVGGMWVAPQWRQQGVGRLLLQAVFTWARDRQLARLGLWVPAHSPAAIALYRRAGFCETGHRRPLPTNAAFEIFEMECKL